MRTASGPELYRARGWWRPELLDDLVLRYLRRELRTESGDGQLSLLDPGDGDDQLIEAELVRARAVAELAEALTVELAQTGGARLLEEIEILVGKVGLTPHDALATATVNPARCMGRGGEFGVIAPGARADLLLLDADPLEDIGNLRRRAGVMARGLWFPESDLQARLTALSSS
jgi:hypothetical protein